MIFYSKIEFFKIVLPDIYASKYLEKGIRTDGRLFDQMRFLSFNSGNLILLTNS